jgi:hypothetical protein
MLENTSTEFENEDDELPEQLTNACLAANAKSTADSRVEVEPPTLTVDTRRKEMDDILTDFRHFIAEWEEMQTQRDEHIRKALNDIQNSLSSVHDVLYDIIVIIKDTYSHGTVKTIR